MGRMADTVLKKSNAAEKEMELRVVHYAKEKDKKKSKAVDKGPKNPIEIVKEYAMLIYDSERLQKINFLNVTLAWISQIVKAEFDKSASAHLDAYS